VKASQAGKIEYDVWMLFLQPTEKVLLQTKKKKSCTPGWRRGLKVVKGGGGRLQEFLEVK